ncbi:MAG: response regulator [Mucilaginibacter sp.]|nr:response regulator [Mucilaginibacter sp.]
MDSNKPTEVLIIDDQEVDRQISTLLLNKHDKDLIVHPFADGQEAIAYLNNLLSAKRSLPDYILLDLVMPAMDGWQFLEAYEKLSIAGHTGPKIIILTGVADTQRLHSSRFPSQIKVIVTKPLTPDHIKLIFGMN